MQNLKQMFVFVSMFYALAFRALGLCRVLLGPCGLHAGLCSSGEGVFGLFAWGASIESRTSRRLGVGLVFAVSNHLKGFGFALLELLAKSYRGLGLEGFTVAYAMLHYGMLWYKPQPTKHIKALQPVKSLCLRP